MFKITEEINDILDLGYSLSTEQFYLRLFDLVMEGCMKFTGADAGDLFIENNGEFQHLISINNTVGYYMGRGAEAVAEAGLDMKEHNLIAYTAANRKISNFPDIYQEKQFDIVHIKEFDAEHDYRTRSLMVVPVYSPGAKVLGVMQLANCMDDAGNVITFPKEYESMVNSLTSQLAIAITNMNLIQELEELLKSFVSSMTTAIDARTPYNANHTVHVNQYCMEFCEFINALHTKGEFPCFISEEDREQLSMAAMLHDLGKMITPREVMNKSTRLGTRYEALYSKLEKIKLLIKIDILEGRKEKDQWNKEIKKLEDFMERLDDINHKEALSAEDIRKVEYLSKQVYKAEDGAVIPYFDDYELDCLSIVRGTLTADERRIAEQHVVYTDKMLEKIQFNEQFKKVRKIAVSHHEYLDGSGYPNHLQGYELDMLTRILTIIDIYDSLTSTDRPYKGPMTVKEAMSIIEGMAKEGKLDIELVRIFNDFILARN